MKLIKKLACVMLSIALLMGCALTSIAEEAARFEATVDWDAEYDVVVIGYGAAGAVAAITAAEQGARVLIVEKAPKGLEGGNSRYSCELVLSPTDREKAITYFKLMRGNFNDQTDEMIEAIVDGLMGNEIWLLGHGANPETTFGFPFMEFPEFEGSDSMRVVTTDFVLYSGGLFGLMADNVENLSDSIDVWYSAPAVRLIQDKQTRIVHGVIVCAKDGEHNVRAKNGVIMAMGGFENNDAMLENYAQMASGKAIGAHFNTGDGIKMAIDVGADLWHMSNIAGPTANFINPMSGTAMFYGLTSTGTTSGYTGFGMTSEILVGGDGTRFQNDGSIGSHGRFNVSGSEMILNFPENAWCVMDAKVAEGSIKPYLSWSEGMVEEIEKGWVIKADTLEELAEMMNVPAENLVREVAQYNGFCADQNDVKFNRSPETLIPLDKAPFYAFRVYPTLTNTQGGARRNVDCEVVDVWGDAIPHLYSAGEFGSFYCDAYNGGGNLGECIWTGRKAAENAAIVKDDTTQENLMTREALDLRTAEPEYELNEHEYIGRGLGIGTNLTVKVKYENGIIGDVTILANYETPGIGSKAVEQIPAAIVAANSTNVDTVTGATVTSVAIINAVNDALSHAE